LNVIIYLPRTIAAKFLFSLFSLSNLLLSPRKQIWNNRWNWSRRPFKRYVLIVEKLKKKEELKKYILIT